MKYIKIVLKVLLFIFLLTIIMSFVIENIVVETFSQEILSKKVSRYLLDGIFYDVDINELEIIKDNIKNDKSTKKITSKFINTVIENTMQKGKDKIDIENEVDVLISKYLPNEVSEEELQDKRTNVIKQITNTEEDLQNNLLHAFGDEYLIILKIYNIATNIYFRIIITILSLVNITILCVLEKYRVLNFMKNTSIIITIIMLVLFVLIKLLSNFIDQRLAGGWLQQINTNPLIISIVIGSIISILLILINKAINLKAQELESLQNDINQKVLTNGNKGE